MYRIVIMICSLLANSISEKEDCDLRNTCKYSKEADLPICYCDEECLYFNDCCKEFILFDNHTANLANRKPYSCVDLMSKSRKEAVQIGSFMINSCKITGLECDVNPGRLESIIPVSNEKQTFRNSLCAACNGVKNFTYWSILYEIPKSTEIKSLYFKSLLNETILTKLKDNIFPNRQYNLYPPDGIVPRYCSPEIVAGEMSLQHVKQYQQFASCENILFKNSELCLQNLKNTSSFSDEIKCLSYDSSYLTTKNLTFQKGMGTVPKSLQILVQPVPLNNALDTLTQGDIERSSFSFMRKRVYIHFEIDLKEEEVMNTTSKSVKLIEECLSASMVFLQSSKYSLTTEYFLLQMETLDRLKYLSAAGFRSMAKLSMSELENLLNLFVYLQFKDFKGDTIASGFLQTVPSNFSYSRKNANKKHVPVELSMIILISNNMRNSCRNVSFLRQRRMPTTIAYEVSCIGDDTEDTVTRNLGCIIFLHKALVLLSLMCTMWKLTIT